MPFQLEPSFLGTVGNVLSLALRIYALLIIARVLLSWISANPKNQVMRYLGQLTDPMIFKARRWFPLVLGGLDFSPVVLIILIQVLAAVVQGSLTFIGYGLGPLVILPVLLMALVEVVSSLIWFLMIVMVARLVMSMVSPSPYNPLVMVTYALTEPLLAPLRKLIPRNPNGFDARALVFLLMLFLVNYVLMNMLRALTLQWITAMFETALL